MELCVEAFVSLAIPTDDWTGSAETRRHKTLEDGIKGTDLS